MEDASAAGASLGSDRLTYLVLDPNGVPELVTVAVAEVVTPTVVHGLVWVSAPSERLSKLSLTSIAACAGMANAMVEASSERFDFMNAR